LYNKSQTENHDLRVKNKAQGKIIRNLVIVVIALALFIIIPFVIKILRMCRIIPV
jgi:hypothetical protein